MINTFIKDQNANPVVSRKSKQKPCYGNNKLSNRYTNLCYQSNLAIVDCKENKLSDRYYQI